MQKSKLEITATEFSFFLNTAGGKSYRESVLKQLRDINLSQEDAEKVFEQYTQLKYNETKRKAREKAREEIQDSISRYQ